MDEARRVLDRLGRIDELRSAGAPPRRLLAELRALVREGEQWTAAERSGTRAARAALDLLDRRLAGCEEAAAAEPPREEVVASNRG